MKKSLYLCGPDMQIPEGQALASKSPQSWRSAVFHFCMKQGIQVINPLAEAKNTLNTNGRMFIAEDRSRKEVEQALGLVDRCDFLLANLHNSDESSLIPLIHGYNQGKHTVVWTPFPVSPWIGSYAKASFDSLEDTLEHLVIQSFDDQKSIIDWSIQYENGLKGQSEKFPPGGEPDFQYFPGEGNKPVLILAPHATSYWHLGGLVEAEGYTGALSSSLSRLTGNPSIISSYCSAEDSLYTFNSSSLSKSITNPLIGFIEKLIKLHNLKMILVFRGSHWDSRRELNVQSFLPASINSCEHLDEFKRILDYQSQNRQISCKFDKASSESQLKELSNFFKIPILEIAVHKSFLIPQMQRAHYHNLVTMLEAALNQV
jgi:hypothetical protein